MSTDFVRGTRLRNAFNRETFVFSGLLDNRDVARFGVILETGGSGGGNALVHVHPGADEHFAVRSGRVKFVVDGREHVVEAGGSVTVPRGRPHYFANAGDCNAELDVSFTPAQQHLRFFANFVTLTMKQPKWFSSAGDPNVLLIALVLHAYRDHMYLAGLPIWLQKLMFAVLAPLARLAGYRLAIEPLREAPVPARSGFAG
ncbi:cupin domain-containing protein [Bradyrhizobium symbiodeficiens]|uniref:Cupin domain-containing protein n=1 Tax=Bradyrhizobium symbiodeficiens TaxID=1404367 RepID=A0ABX5W8C7_9BRAD|nr:cupin domain-containing protein [Bradyrhizobium symbiodeficiens]QDF38499.1 cupin domain-containing protein [Bradyrhizobium symbiodeficiens]